MMICATALLLLARADHKNLARFSTCASCVEAGLGWSPKKRKCGGFANKICPSPRNVSGSFFGALPIVGEVPRIRWDPQDPHFAQTIARRRTPAVLTDPPVVSTWSAFKHWSTPGYLESKIGSGLVKFDQAYEENFLYFNNRHAWADRARLNDIDPGARLGPGKGEGWVVPATQIKMTLAMFHHEANASWSTPGAVSRTTPQLCATENTPCDCPPGGRVRYGAAPRWSKWRTMRRGEERINCGNQVFGDPAPGVGKTCECRPHASRRGGRARPRWVYHSKALAGSHNNPWSPVLEDITPIHDFWVPPLPGASETQDAPISHLWYGSAGCRTRPHFDFYENFFVQVLGSKRWLLAAPRHYSEMYVLPASHPSGRQSALDWPHRRTADFPLASPRAVAAATIRAGGGDGGGDGGGVDDGGVQLLEAVLQPGEVLYVPPVWFHSTQALGPGPNLGLSYWSESELQTHLDRLREDLTQRCAAELEGGGQPALSLRKLQLLHGIAELVRQALQPAVVDVGAAAAPAAATAVRGIMAPEVAGELRLFFARFAHSSDEFRLRCADAGRRGGGGGAAGGWMHGPPEIPPQPRCLSQLPQRFIAAVSEVPPGAQQSPAQNGGLLRALVASFAEVVAEAVLPSDAVCPFFAEAFAGLEPAL